MKNAKLARSARERLYFLLIPLRSIEAAADSTLLSASFIFSRLPLERLSQTCE